MITSMVLYNSLTIMEKTVNKLIVLYIFVAASIFLTIGVILIIRRKYQTQLNKNNGGIKMATLKDEALMYESQQTKNIADLKEVDVELNLEDRKGKDKDGKVFEYKVIVIDGDDYRVPGKVLGDLRSILEKKPSLKKFAVTKKGTGLNTTYTVIPMD